MNPSYGKYSDQFILKLEETGSHSFLITYMCVNQIPMGYVTE